MKKVLIIPFFALLLIVFAACGSSNDDGANSANDTATKEIVTVKHMLDETKVQKNPEKVIVFDFGILDTLDYLNIDVVGVPKMSIPSYLEKYSGDEYENIGSLKEPDFEKIATINPDLIIISSRQAELYEELSELGSVIYLGVDQTNYMESFKENTKIIGEIFDKSEEVEQKLVEIEEQINELKEIAQSSNKKALILLANDNKISAYGPSSRYGLIHDEFGIAPVDEGIEVSTHGMNVTFEYVLEQNPDLIYVIDRSAAIGEESSAKDIVENDLVSKTTAMQNDDIYYLNPDIWYLSGGGIISVQEMINELASSLQ